MSGVVVWFTGLPASGKSTLAADVASALVEQGERPVTLDGDDIRRVLVPAPGYDAAAREGYYSTLGNLAALLAAQGFVVLVPATANRAHFRRHAREQAPAFVEVFVSTKASECSRRDPKGLYASAADAGGGMLPGVQVPYEEPEQAEVVADGGTSPEAVTAVLAAIERSTS